MLLVSPDKKKMVLYAIQRSELACSQYLTDMSVFRGHPEMLVFVDETGADRKDCMRRFVYSLRGWPAMSHKLLVRGQQVSAIAAMHRCNVLACNCSMFCMCIRSGLLHNVVHFLVNNMNTGKDTINNTQAGIQ